jgi:hypothetical protein
MLEGREKSEAFRYIFVAIATARNLTQLPPKLVETP